MSKPENIWSRRRAAVLAEAEADTKTAERADSAVKQTEMAKQSDAQILMELNLKDPDKMQQGDDFASFMLAEVPERLRKRALRTLWRSNPVLACVDDLLEYGEDFKAEWDGADLIKTVYRVGKGMLPDVEETPVVPKSEVTEDKSEDKPEGKSENGSEDGSENTPEELELTEATPDPEVEIQDQDVLKQADLDQPSDPLSPQYNTRQTHRMRFDFDEVT